MIKKQETSWNILCLSPLVKCHIVKVLLYILCLTVETRNKLEYFMFMYFFLGNRSLQFYLGIWYDELQTMEDDLSKIPEDQEDVSRLSTVFEAQEKLKRFYNGF
uniref:Uncharacterized protein n=1 Tax=Gossypium raimondii TaxID=29730 RepID=A0A0D2VAQ0_GOSRA|nr:hypothetical protein B456_010G151700 [Gossypium raimondii]KJB66676.1 hypothetical protein B456_010G151700 [Gossypium raimondii]